MNRKVAKRGDASMSPDRPDRPDPPDHRPTPEERYLQKKLAELADLESILAERELELHTLRGGLLAFEKQYQAAVGAKYAELDELKARLAELIPAAAGGTPSDDAKGQAAKSTPPRSKSKSKST